MCALIFVLEFVSLLQDIVFDGRVVVTWHAQQVLDIDLLRSVSRTCHSGAKRVPDHLHGSFLVLCHYFSGSYILSAL